MYKLKFDEPIKIEVVRPFGPTIAKIKMPEKLVNYLNQYVDNVNKNENVVNKLNHGKFLAGNVKQEFKIDKKFMYQKFLI